jgi:glycosyltransferase involved in cell wall biosynthesis
MISSLFVTDSPEIWGAELSLLDIAAEGARIGNRVTIAAPSTSPIHAECVVRGIDSIVVDLPTHPMLDRGGLRRARIRDLPREVLAVISGARMIGRLAKDHDVVVSFTLWRNLEVALGCLFNRKGAVDLHETFEGTAGTIVSKLILLLFGRILAPSHYVARRSGARARAVTVIPRALELPQGEHSMAGTNTSPLVVGIFGQLREHKGHELLVRAAEIAARVEPLRILIVGEGGDDSVVKLVDDAVARNESLFCRLPRTGAPISLMASCHVVVNVSRHEAFGRTMIEAMAAGAVPVAAGLGGPAEIITSTGNGIVSARNPEALAKALVSIARDRTTVANARSRGPNIVRTTFAIEAIAPQYFRALATGAKANPRLSRNVSH